MRMALVQAKPKLIKIQPQKKTSSYDAGKFEEEKKFFIDKFIGLGRAISMKVLHEIYGIAVGDDR